MPGEVSNRLQRLLLVDDEPVVLATLSEGLTRAGFSVVAASGSAQALAQVREARYALAILDYAIPGVNGLGIAQEMTQLRQPFMFLSAYAEHELVDRAVAAGALAFVVKPIDPVQLVPAVRAAVQRAHEMSALLEQTERLSKAIETNRDVSVAVGLLMAQRGLSRRVAYETLRQHARRTRRRLHEFAAELTASAELIFSVPVGDCASGADDDSDVGSAREPSPSSGGLPRLKPSGS